MTGSEIIAKVKSLNLPLNSYVVFRSGPLAAAGIRGANDIDLYVSLGVYEQLKVKGWQSLEKSPRDIALTYDVFEAHDNWNFSPYNPTLNDLLLGAKIIDDVPFASLNDVSKWKSAAKRPKDKADLKLIAYYLNGN